jgi:hypothetical protein
MKRLPVLLTLFFLSYCILSAKNKENHPINVSIWNPVAISPYDSLAISNVTLGFCSKTQNLNGLGLNLFGHFNEGGINGLSINGVGEYVKGDMDGIELSGFCNVVGGRMRGIQISTVQNTDVACAKGVMIAGLTNFSIGNASGIQLSALTNIVGSHFGGMQATLGINMASSSSFIQLAGLVNITAKSARGVQIGLGNYADTIHGMQLGLINLCGERVHGLQIGIVNHSIDTSAVKLGLININPKTRIQLLAFGGNITRSNLAVRFKSRYTYTILGAGNHYWGLKNKFSGSIFYRIGVGLPLLRYFFVSTDAGIAHIKNFDDNSETIHPKRLYSLQLRMNLECHPFSRFGIFASGGYANTRHYGSGGVFEKKNIIEMGIILF